MALLRAENISKKINNNLIVDDINFEQQHLQKIAIAGESGSGKTTLLKIISGHLQPTGGTVLFNNERVIGPEEKLLPGHKHIAYLSQHYELLNNYRVEELIWFENKTDKAEATRLFEICGINHLLTRKTHELSGGEKQRIALCMLLVKKPTLLILDEPFSNLDPVNTGILKTVLDNITSGLKITCLLTSHEPHDTLAWADKIIIMNKGKIIQQSSPEEIYYKPVNEYAAGLFGKYNLLKPNIAALFAIESNGNDVMTRPENFSLYKTGSGVKGIIHKISFCGGYNEAEVIVEDTKIIVRTNDKFKAEDKIFIRLS